MSCPLELYWTDGGKIGVTSSELWPSSHDPALEGFLVVSLRCSRRISSAACAALCVTSFAHYLITNHCLPCLCINSGTIELHELQQVMRKLGQNPSEDDLKEMIGTVDDNGDNEIDFDEFVLLMKRQGANRDPEKELRDAFAVFDTDGSGEIDRKELKRLMKKLGQALTEAEIDAMMDEVDTNGDGEISFEEFKALMQN